MTTFISRSLKINRIFQDPTLNMLYNSYYWYIDRQLIHAECLFSSQIISEGVNTEVAIEINIRELKVTQEISGS